MIRFAGRFSMLKVAATLAAVMILIGTGWGAEKMYQKFFTKVSVTLERSPTREWNLPDGRNLFTSGLIGTVVDPDDPKAVETAKRHHEEMKQLLAQKKYDFIKTSELMGRKEYVYKFTFADGSHDEYELFHASGQCRLMGRLSAEARAKGETATRANQQGARCRPVPLDRQRRDAHPYLPRGRHEPKISNPADLPSRSLRRRLFIARSHCIAHSMSGPKKRQPRCPRQAGRTTWMRSATGNGNS